MWQSKRFIAFGVATLLFILLVFFTKYSPMELAGSISLICGVYIGGETIRKSENSEKID